MTTVSAAAAAKLNLYLHVLGKRPDGYHELDSLVVFATAHDLITVTEAPGFSLAIDGPFGSTLVAEGTGRNLVSRAAHALADALGRDPHVAIRLTKNLPVASGIGGGSADAAATLKALAELWGVAQDDARLVELAPTLGADVPVCLFGRTAYFGGAGEQVVAGPALPPAALLLVNPGVHMPTKDVFAARAGAWSTAGRLERDPVDVADFAQLLRARGNDLGAAAESLSPAITDVLAALDATPGCLLGRMSGSGATCIGLYADVAAAASAAALINRVRPTWWVKATALLPEVPAAEVVADA
ncbi:4-(cytidine 5'-diphospho)-2-C-methyl-D-erythritol kinase [Nitrospirillum viridazoti]|uniref:4-diphosphocytidyl-2-C-methyl-D-erythritol kinase n=1 Tax=Nitrospirillum amazonense TaxID=28077 RepID=A0A560HJ36_9PROT|nr:4-(cytidine 5'-diphospho)-2-C-methyl-D-erythritol kinase [Nitrospirillum amazonense]TWB46496.1 4-diphosphocytidyl-2-C-methyl-D-erythritol kinase [Nitrospirillum amazonense]